MRKLLSVAGLLLAVAAAASAQAAQDPPRLELFGGYSYARLETLSPDRSHLNGWDLGLQANLNDWLGFVADFSGHYGQRQVSPGVNADVNTHTGLFGPRVRLPGRVRPFAHALFGVARGNAGVFGSTSSETAFGMAAGGGIDADLTDNGRVSWRIIQADYLMNRFFDRNNNNFRLASGFVFRF